jgi:hypothetical protein
MNVSRSWRMAIDEHDEAHLDEVASLISQLAVVIEL